LCLSIQRDRFTIEEVQACMAIRQKRLMDAAINILMDVMALAP